MKLKVKVLQAIKQFAKDIGVPDAIILDAASKQKSQAFQNLCSKIDTTLWVLEEGTAWANKDELYIEIVKEMVQKDMNISNWPLSFWDLNWKTSSYQQYDG